MVASSERARIHYLDNLRAVAMLLGVYLHGALAYADPSREVWVATNPEGSVVVDVTIWWIHLFRMSLFFLLSGYFAKMMIERKGLKTFLINRGIRIALPFVLFYPLLLVATTIVFIFAISYVKEPQGLLGLIVAASKNPDAASEGPPYTTMHLWFIYYLMMFSLIAALASRWKGMKVEALFQTRWLLALAPLALVPGVMAARLPMAAPESFVPHWWPFAYYGLFYWAGWQLFGREKFLEQLQPWCWPLLVLSLIMFVPHYLLLPTLDLTAVKNGSTLTPPSPGLIESALAAYLSVTLTLSALLLGQRLLSRSSALMKLIADSSYWVYLVHLPVIFFLQTLLIPVQWPVWAKLSAVTGLAWLFCMATYVVFVRYTPIGWMLNGKRSFP